MDPTLHARAIEVNWLNLALGHETFAAAGATFVVNRAIPFIHDANFVYDATASTPEEIDALLAHAHRVHAHSQSLTFRVDSDTSPELEARLALDGAPRAGTLVMILEGDLRGSAMEHDLRPIDDERGWDAMVELKRASWREDAPKHGEDPARTEVPDGLTAASRLKSPAVRYTLAYADGKPVGFFNAWEGIDGVGQVEDLFVLPEHRHRGIATALIHHCVADARARGARAVVICSDPSDTPKRMYAAMGWRPIAVCRQYGVANRE